MIWIIVGVIWLLAFYMWRKAKEEERQRLAKIEDDRNRRAYFDEKYKANIFARKV